MSLAVSNQGHAHLIETAGVLYVTATTVVIEVEANCQGASVTAMVIPLLHSPLSCWSCGLPDHLMAKCPHNKNESAIKTNLVDNGVHEDASSLVEFNISIINKGY